MSPTKPTSPTEMHCNENWYEEHLDSEFKRIFINKIKELKENADKQLKELVMETQEYKNMQLNEIHYLKVN